VKARRSDLPRRARGFTLTELAVVVTIIALILGGVVLTMGAVTSAREIEQTQRQLDEAREALMGFFLRNGRFPCPAAPGATGIESFVSPGALPAPPPPVPVPVFDVRCSNPFDGFLPAVTLGLSRTDNQGYLIDAWGNRIRYAVTQWIPPATPPFVPPYDATQCPPNTATPDFRRCPAFTTSGGVAAQGIANIPIGAASMLSVCNRMACGAPALPELPVSFFAPVVVFSTGRNTATVAPLLDELENVNNDGTFVVHTPRPADAAAGEFDDLVTWISPNILFNRLIAAGAI
jgi:prepilin-type N-terminal cleavage/methylation domain-containing protein